MRVLMSRIDLPLNGRTAPRPTRCMHAKVHVKALNPDDSAAADWTEDLPVVAGP